MGIFQRLFKIGQSEAHAIADKLEDPIKMTEQGIRDLKKDLDAAVQGLAEVKSLVISLERQIGEAKEVSGSHEKKAMALLTKAGQGEIDPAQADQLATALLAKKSEADNQAARLETDYKAQSVMADKLQAQVDNLRKTISTYENELITLRARAKTAESMKKINKQLAGVDSSSTVALLERMKNKVQEDEAAAQAYGEIAAGSASVEDKVDELLAETPSNKEDELAALKRKMGLIQ